jgi:hypothetical protein
VVDSGFAHFESLTFAVSVCRDRNRDLCHGLLDDIEPIAISAYIELLGTETANRLSSGAEADGVEVNHGLIAVVGLESCARAGIAENIAAVRKDARNIALFKGLLLILNRVHQ